MSPGDNLQDRWGMAGHQLACVEAGNHAVHWYMIAELVCDHPCIHQPLVLGIQESWSTICHLCGMQAGLCRNKQRLDVGLLLRTLDMLGFVMGALNAGECILEIVKLEQIPVK